MEVSQAAKDVYRGGGAVPGCACHSDRDPPL